MSNILIALIIVAIFILMGVQSIITKLKNPVWGTIIPIGIFIAAIYAHFFAKVGITYVNVMVFLLPFVWCLIECYRGRKRRIAEMEKEILKMKAKDIS